MARDAEELLSGFGEALARACARDPKLREIVAELRRAGFQVRVVLRPQLARGAGGIVFELQHPWSRRWSQEDVEALHALGIALEENGRQFPSEPDSYPR